MMSGQFQIFNFDFAILFTLFIPIIILKKIYFIFIRIVESWNCEIVKNWIVLTVEFFFVRSE